MSKVAPKMRQSVRDLAYLDTERLEDYLSPLLGGMPNAIQEAGSDAKSKTEVSGQIKGVGPKWVGPQSATSWREMKDATPASLFATLYSHLNDADSIQFLDGFDRRIWNQLDEGEFVDVSATVAFSAVEAILERLPFIKRYMELFKPEEVSESWKQLGQYLDLLSEFRDSYNVRISPAGAPNDRHVFVASLDRRYVRTSKSSLTGRYRVLGRVQQKIERGNDFELFSLFPGIALPRENLESLLQTFKTLPSLFGPSPDMVDFLVPFPAMVLTVVALYR